MAGPTRERCPEHSPTRVRRAASIRSALAVSSSCVSSRTPSLWKIFSAPGSSRARTIRFCTAWERRVTSESPVHRVQRMSQQVPAGQPVQPQAPTSAPNLWRARSAGRTPWAALTSEHCSALPAFQPSCNTLRSPKLKPFASCPHPFLQDPARSGTSAPPLNPCRTWSSSGTEQNEQLSPHHPTQPSTGGHSSPCTTLRSPSRACCCPGHAEPPGRPCSWAPGSHSAAGH